jgi:hypothetical protein
VSLKASRLHRHPVEDAPRNGRGYAQREVLATPASRWMPVPYYAGLVKEHFPDRRWVKFLCGGQFFGRENWLVRLRYCVGCVSCLWHDSRVRRIRRIAAHIL